MNPFSVGKPRKSVAIEGVLAIAIATTSFCPSQYLNDIEQVEAFRIPPITSFASSTEYLRIVSPATAQEMIADLRQGGIPVSAIAEAMGVERKTIYAWLTGANLIGNKTLRDLMIADNIDGSAVRSALDNLRPTALRAMASERKMSRQGPTNAVLDEIPEAGANG